MYLGYMIGSMVTAGIIVYQNAISLVSAIKFKTTE